MDYAVLRRNMVQNQIFTNHVTDARVLGAMADVPREPFVPPALKDVAYIDGEPSLGNGRALMQPMVFARLLQAVEFGAQDLVLDIGSATGYSAAVLSKLAGTVVALEEDEALAAQSGPLLAAMQVDNVVPVVGPLVMGDAGHGPYDVIVLEGRVAKVPRELCVQLAEGGRLAAVVGDGQGSARAVLYKRIGGSFFPRVLFEAGASLLPGFAPRSEFIF